MLVKIIVLVALVHLHAAEASSLVPKIMYGKPINSDHHKHLILVKIDKGKYSDKCTGSILSHRWIITAAHCFDTFSNQKIDISHYHNKTLVLIATSNGNKIVHHPEFDVDISGTDMALVKTDHMIRFNEFVQPIRLANRLPRFGDKAVIAGYGQTEDGKAKIPPRQAVVVISGCDSNNPGQLCSQNKMRPSFGDSGGPLTIGGQLVGTVVAGDETKRPTQCIYASIIPNAKWINSVIRRC